MARAKRVRLAAIVAATPLGRISEAHRGMRSMTILHVAKAVAERSECCLPALQTRRETENHQQKSPGSVLPGLGG